MTPRATNAGAVRHDGVSVMTTPIVNPTTNTDNLKCCGKCHEWKPLEAFHRSSSRRDGLQFKCKSCAAKASKAWAEANRERKSATDKAWWAAHPERRSELAKAWLEANRERKDATNKAWAAANRERLAETTRAWADANHERKAAANKAWAAANPDKRKATKHRYRASVRNSEENYTSSDLAAIRAAQTDKQGRLICWRCGKPIKGVPDLDHWIPLKEGGSNGPGNLHYMHVKCNRSKGAKLPTEIGRLL
jgi:hypothetical protein